MKVAHYLPFALALLFAALASPASAQVKEGEQLLPELGIYVDINEEEWGAAKVNLRIVNNNFQMYFLDEQNLLVPPPLDKVIVHYGNFIKDSNARETLLLEQRGMMLTSIRVIPPPHRYLVRIFLKKTVDPEEYYKDPYEVKEFIGMHTINQLGSQFVEESRTQPFSEPLPTGDKEGEALPDNPVANDDVNVEGTEAKSALGEAESNNGGQAQ